MKVVGVTACTIGIAHTYIAKDKLVNAAKKLNIECKIETQGNIGVQNELTEEDIKNADVVIIASDINISRRERFKGKRIVQVPVSTAIKSPEGLLKKIQQKINEQGGQK
jgi:PTS system fructose-specific IIB component